MRKIFTAAFAAFAIASGATPAAASETVTLALDISHVDLTNAAEVTLLDDAIVEAAREACGRPFGSRLDAYAAAQECQAELIEAARARLAEIRQVATEETFAAL